MGFASVVIFLIASVLLFFEKSEHFIEINGKQNFGSFAMKVFNTGLNYEIYCLDR